MILPNPKTGEGKGIRMKGRWEGAIFLAIFGNEDGKEKISALQLPHDSLSSQFPSFIFYHGTKFLQECLGYSFLSPLLKDWHSRSPVSYASIEQPLKMDQCFLNT
jgi:hypothetical protein